MKAPALSMMLAVTLSACTSTQDVLEPSALLSDSEPQQTEFPLATPSGSSGQPQGQVTAIVTDARVQFAPVVGAPSEVSAPLSSRLATRAAARGITLIQPGTTPATLVMKGYFSAITEPNETTVIYVWDVVDASGNRVHRIQGQAKSPVGNAEGWSSVQPATMEAIADQTVDQLAAWLVSRQG